MDRNAESREIVHSLLDRIDSDPLFRERVTSNPKQALLDVGWTADRIHNISALKCKRTCENTCLKTCTHTCVDTDKKGPAR